ncbi:hypothetical protein B0J12DRAFT_645369 [Macrophomina phaseolina]|uniref:Secreted protein n=1 Tax=Macrophomina phaseolina TaxID=35725 RepID=A0ABQ8GQF4_9PEZI|nr:hypothetical protein B0J12DRAFT_645369 [Macrophomina phaseolina]
MTWMLHLLLLFCHHGGRQSPSSAVSIAGTGLLPNRSQRNFPPQRCSSLPTTAIGFLDPDLGLPRFRHVGPPELPELLLDTFEAESDITHKITASRSLDRRLGPLPCEREVDRR